MKHSFVNDGDHTILKIFGDIKEKSVFPDIGDMVRSGRPFYIDLEGVSSINSLGIKLWNDWVNKIPNIKQIIFCEVPPCIILQMDMVDQFLPAGASISSFMVPYYCSSCDREINVKFNNLKDVCVEKGEVLINKKVNSLCSEGQCDVEEDIHTKKYFRFLLK